MICIEEKSVEPIIKALTENLIRAEQRLVDLQETIAEQENTLGFIDTTRKELIEALTISDNRFVEIQNIINTANEVKIIDGNSVKPSSELVVENIQKALNGEQGIPF